LRVEGILLGLKLGKQRGDCRFLAGLGAGPAEERGLQQRNVLLRDGQVLALVPDKRRERPSQ